MASLRIQRDDLTGPAVRRLLEAHLALMHAITPEESVHALDLDGLLVPEVTAWTIWKGKLLLGCGALKELNPRHGEIKSMHTRQDQRRSGAATALLEFIIDEARQRGYQRLSLETGSMDEFEPARRLYEKHGFTACSPFADYSEDPNSAFMTREL